MAISDINKAMAMYAQPTEFDQNAWKTAFDIANNFATVSENHRKNRENLATEDWRVSLTNAKNQLDSTVTQGTLQMYDFLKQNAVDENGRVRNAEELLQIGQQQQTLNPALFANLLGNNQKFAQTTAQEIAPYNPQQAAAYRVMGGLSPYTVNNQGQIENFQTGVPMTGALLPEQLMHFAGGNGWQNSLNLQKAQQEAEKAREIAAARSAYEMQEIEARKQADIAKKKYWLENAPTQQPKLTDPTGANWNATSAKVLDERLAELPTDNEEMFRNQATIVAQMYKNNPQAAAYIKQYVENKYREIDWSAAK